MQRMDANGVRGRSRTAWRPSRVVRLGPREPFRPAREAAAPRAGSPRDGGPAHSCPTLPGAPPPPQQNGVIEFSEFADAMAAQGADEELERGCQEVGARGVAAAARLASRLLGVASCSGRGRGAGARLRGGALAERRGMVPAHARCGACRQRVRTLALWRGRRATVPDTSRLHDLTPVPARQVRDVFALFDTDGSGQLSADEVCASGMCWVLAAAVQRRRRGCCRECGDWLCTGSGIDPRPDPPACLPTRPARCDPPPPACSCSARSSFWACACRAARWRCSSLRSMPMATARCGAALGLLLGAAA